MDKGYDERGSQARTRVPLNNTLSIHTTTSHVTKKAFFISDLHLGATYLPDPLEHERRVVRFLDSISSEASELYLLGDILDYWYEYRTVVPRGFTRFFGTLARMADNGIKITWFIGNHDIWLFDYLRDEIGMRIIDGTETATIMGKRFFMSHGDGVGRLPRGFRFLRAMFRNRICQKAYSAIHPRWTIPFAHKWSEHSRDFANSTPQFEGEENEPLIGFCREYLTTADPDIDYFVFGHRHIILEYPLGIGNSRMVILGDWIHHFSYGTFDGDQFQINLFKG